MHLASAFSLASGKKIEKINILEKYYPLPWERYIVLQPFSKDSKSYDRWQSVIDIIKPILDRAKISIIQIGAKDERPIEGVTPIQGSTTINQAAYVIKNSLLVLGCDSFALHLAGHYNLPLVGLYSNNYVNNVCPFFGDKTKQVLLEPERPEGEKPCFSFKEIPKTINTIKPETVALAVCNLLNLPFDFPFSTVYFGESYSIGKLIEMTPDTAINLQSLKLESIVVRMDKLFNEQVLVNQLMVGGCAIVTNKPINIEIIKRFRDRVKQIVYIIDENNDPSFAQTLHKMGVNYALLSFLSEEELNKYKLNYLDTAFIFRKDVPKSINDTPFKNLDVSKLYYKSSKITLGKQKIFPSSAALNQNLPVATLHHPFLPVIDSPDFWKEIEYFHIVQMAD